jgi:Fe2+ transport system protein FeoA
MSLDQLEPGQVGKILGVTGAGAIKRRLLDLGFRRGEVVTMIKSAPLKDPLQISIGNGHISIRRKEASLVTVEVLLGIDGERG